MSRTAAASLKLGPCVSRFRWRKRHEGGAQLHGRFDGHVAERRDGGVGRDELRLERVLRLDEEGRRPAFRGHDGEQHVGLRGQKDAAVFV